VSSVISGRKTITTAGTAERLAASTPVKGVAVQALSSNAQNIAIGGSGVNAALGSENGIVLAASASVSLPCDDLTDVFLDVLADGEGISYSGVAA
jgi:hypothetical protein